MCLNDADCIAVSCEETEDDDECSRAMLSNSCDDTTIDPQSGWTIHLLKTGLYFFETKNCNQVFSKKCNVLFLVPQYFDVFILLVSTTKTATTTTATSSTTTTTIAPKTTKRTTTMAVLGKTY